MATQVQMWASVDGKVHATEAEANQHDHELRKFNLAKVIGRHLNVSGIEPAILSAFGNKNARELIHTLLDLTKDPSNS